MHEIGPEYRRLLSHHGGGHATGVKCQHWWCGLRFGTMQLQGNLLSGPICEQEGLAAGPKPKLQRTGLIGQLQMLSNILSRQGFCCKGQDSLDGCKTFLTSSADRAFVAKDGTRGEGLGTAVLLAIQRAHSTLH